MVNYEVNYTIKGTEFLKADSPIEAEEKAKDNLLETFETWPIERSDIDVVEVIEN